MNADKKRALERLTRKYGRIKREQYLPRRLRTLRTAS